MVFGRSSKRWLVGLADRPSHRPQALIGGLTGWWFHLYITNPVFHWLFLVTEDVFSCFLGPFSGFFCLRTQHSFFILWRDWFQFDGFGTVHTRQDNTCLQHSREQLFQSLSLWWIPLLSMIWFVEMSFVSLGITIVCIIRCVFSWIGCMTRWLILHSSCGLRSIVS